MATCITGDKIYILSCLNIFADVTGSIGSWSSFYLYVMTFFFFFCYEYCYMYYWEKEIWLSKQHSSEKKEVEHLPMFSIKSLELSQEVLRTYPA